MVKRRIGGWIQAGFALVLSVGLFGAHAQTQDGVQVGSTSKFAKLVPAADVETASAQQYNKMLQTAASKQALAPPTHTQLQRLRHIAQRVIPYSYGWNTRAQQWTWEVNLIASNQINAFCMPGGKIAFYTGLLDQLKLTDDEVAMVMGHEIAHALREHARERMGKQAATNVGANLLSSLLGLGQVGQAVTGYGAQLLSLKFSREDESEADLVGMELAARAGYDPRAGVSLWQKMTTSGKSAPPQWLSTHPSGSSRIAEIEANLPKVLPLYERSRNAAR
jgi:predicted Zn-dependent protease